MVKKEITFAALQITAILVSYFVLGFALAGSHGRLYFSNVGGTVALIITIILTTPLLYLLIERRKLQKTKLFFTVGIFIFCLSMTALYVGFPAVTKKFIIDKDYINNVSISKEDDLKVNFKLLPEMFSRVGIEATIEKANDIGLKEFNLIVYNNRGEIIEPVFRPLAWNSQHSETIQMDSFFEPNAYSKLNRFALTGQYSIEHTDSLKMSIDYVFTKNGQTVSKKSKLELGLQVI